METVYFIQNKIKAFIEEYHMIKQDDRVVLGLSGGADSVCMLLILKELSAIMKFDIIAVHVEHGIRGGESLRDAAFVTDLCRQNEIPLYVFPVDVPGFADKEHMSIEEAARWLRYDCFGQACDKYGGDKIAVAHHADDCAETVIFNLVRGSALKGLRGITPMRSYGKYTIIRPMLCTDRKEVEDYLRFCGQEYCMDSTNSDIDPARNRIRNLVMPELELINSRSAHHIANTAKYIDEVSSYIDVMTKRAAAECVRYSYSDGKIMEAGVNVKDFQMLDSVIKKNLILSILDMLAGSRKDISSVHIEKVCALFGNRTGKRVSLPYGITAKNEYENVVFFHGENKLNGEEKKFSATDICVPGKTHSPLCGDICTEILEFDGDCEKVPRKMYTKWFDYDKIRNSVQIRTRRQGDFFQTDARGGHKKIKNFMIDEKIPADRRDEIPLLADGDHIMWVAGHRISEYYKVTRKTKHVLVVCINGRIK